MRSLRPVAAVLSDRAEVAVGDRALMGQYQVILLDQMVGRRLPALAAEPGERTHSRELSVRAPGAPQRCQGR
jgi:hypothetical protein